MILSPKDKRSLDEWKAYCDMVQASTSRNLFETAEAQSERKKRALIDYNYFVKTYFPLYADADCAYFHIAAANAIIKDPNIFAVLEWPREHAKSVHACLIIPMWLMAHKQLDGMILISRTADMAKALVSDIQAQLQYNDLFIHDWGEQHNQGDWAAGDFTTKSGIRFLALGRGQAPQGARKEQRRPNLGVFSDLDDYEIVNNQKRVLEVVEYLEGALIPALSIKGSRIIGEGNGIHPRSILRHIVGDVLPGSPKRKGLYHSKVYATEKPTTKGGTGSGVKAYISEGGIPSWERYSLEELQAKFNKVGIIKTKGEYYHEHSIEGKIFKDAYIHFRKLPPLREMVAIVGYFDPSFENKPTSDFKAVCVWGLKDDKYYCLKQFVQRAEISAAFAFMSKVDDSMPMGTAVIWYIEKQFYNRPFTDALDSHNADRKKMGLSPLRLIFDGRDKPNKYTRMVLMEPRYSNNQVFYNIDEIHSPDMIEGNNQLKGIEPGYHSPDDAPDATEGAFHYLDKHLTTRNTQPIIGTRKTIKRW